MATIRLTMLADGRVCASPVSYLGGDFDAYRDACGTGGATYARDVRAPGSSRAGANVTDVESVATLVASLEAARFTVELHPDVASAAAARAASLRAVDDAGREALRPLIAALAEQGRAFFPFQEQGVTFLLSNHRRLLGDDQGLGKGHPEGTRILTPAGPRTIETLRPGDLVIGSDGHPTKVTGIFDRGILEVFNVRFNDGSSVVCDGDHLWAVRTANQAQRGQPFAPRQVRDLAGDVRPEGGDRKWRIPMVSPIRFKSRPLPLDPYLLGVLLGDGCLTHATPSFTKSDPDLPKLVMSCLPEGAQLSEVSTDRAPTFNIVGPSRGQRDSNPVTAAIRALGLDGRHSHEKFVPEVYLYNDAEVRLALLQGLMDTDGSVGTKDGHLEFGSSSERLADAVAFLVESLGGTARRTTRKTWFTYDGGRVEARPGYRVSIALPNDSVPFRLARKLAFYRPRKKYLPNRILDRIERAGRAHVYCISVEAADRLYVLADYCLVTHNTIQALGAARALEMVERRKVPVLVICPAVAKGVWRREAARWWPTQTVEVLSGRNSFRFPGAGEIVVTNFDVLADVGIPLALVPEPGTVVIVDEIQNAKNPRTTKGARTKAIAGLGLAAGGRAWGLSGTPFENHGGETYAILEVLGIGEEVLGAAWRAKWAAANKPELVAGALRRVMLRRRKVDVLPDLPAKTREDYPVDIERKAHRELDALLVRLGGIEGLDRLLAREAAAEEQPVA